jgi:hypothetical protein
LPPYYYIFKYNINVVERLIKREQVTRDRQNPCLNYYEDEFIDRYSLHKECVLTILAEITDKSRMLEMAEEEHKQKMKYKI